MKVIVGSIALLTWITALGASQLTDSVIEPGHPTINYDGATADRVAELNRRVRAGELTLTFDERTGYLRSLLAALEIPIESQIAVFSGTSLQSRLVNARNPRAIYFNDSTAVGWMPGGFIEVASLDSRQGAMFYLLPQSPMPQPQLARDSRCLQCHYSMATLGVPGFLARSIPSTPTGTIVPWLGNFTTDHRSPLEERWAGWYVTGRGGGRHLGNAPVIDTSIHDVKIEHANLNVTTLAQRFDTAKYLTPHSDIVALLVFDHQMRMMNLLTRLGWQARITQDAPGALDELVHEFVDYLLFVDEAPLERVRGSSGFADRFSAAGVRDSRGRSFRELDLERRLLRYPCSYMIYSDAFEALPAGTRRAVYERVWQVLSGRDRNPKYAKFSPADRLAVTEILRDTKRDLPEVFRSMR